MKTRRGTETVIGKTILAVDKSLLKDYSDLVLESKSLIEELTKLLREHSAKQKKEKGSWALNGDLGHVNEGLRELVRFLK